MKRFVKFFVVAVSVLVPIAANASISVTDQTAILSGITASDTLYYAIGGGLLVVMAGIWGFKQVRKML